MKHPTSNIQHPTSKHAVRRARREKAVAMLIDEMDDEAHFKRRIADAAANGGLTHGPDGKLIHVDFHLLAKELEQRKTIVLREDKPPVKAPIHGKAMNYLWQQAVMS